MTANLTPVTRAREAAEAAFLATHPDYETTRALDDLRAREFSRLDEQGHVYLDYTGSGLYSASQVRRHSDLLLRNVFGNPHSANPTSQASTQLVERCRERVLRFFGADPQEYALIFGSPAGESNSSTSASARSACSA